MGQLEPILLSAQSTHKTGALEAMGAAFDSAVLLAEVASAVTLITLVMVLLVRHRGLYTKGGMMWRKRSLA